jgi:hypothetical protein
MARLAEVCWGERERERTRLIGDEGGRGEGPRRSLSVSFADGQLSRVASLLRDLHLSPLASLFQDREIWCFASLLSLLYATDLGAALPCPSKAADQPVRSVLSLLNLFFPSIIYTNFFYVREIKGGLDLPSLLVL